MRPSAVAGPGELLERDHERARVRGTVDAAVRGDGGALVIEAPAGMGKSRLLAEAREWAAERGATVLRARGTELEQGFPFGVVRQLFERPLLGADPAERERWLAGAAELAADIVTEPPGTDSRGPSRRGPSDPGYAAQHGLYWLASNVAGDAPVVLVVDDLQWCDAPSVRALAFIAQRLDGQPLGTIFAARPLDPVLAPEAASLIADPGIETLHLSALTARAVGELVAVRLGEDPDPAFVRTCHEVTGGNPLLAGELLTEAAARGLHPTAAAAAELRSVVPRGVANAVLLRLARTTPSAATLARALSALGDGAQVGDAAQLAGLGGAELEASLAALISAGVVEGGAETRFAHPILRAAIYSDLSTAERERLHRRAVEILRERGAPSKQIAEQVTHTEPRGERVVVELLRDAAREALMLGDATRAAALLARAIEEPPADADCAAVRLELGRAQARAGTPAAIAVLSELVDGEEGAAIMAAAALELSNLLLLAGRAVEGAAVLRRALDRLPADHPAFEPLQIGLLGLTCTSAAASRDGVAALCGQELPEPGARGMLAAARLASRAMTEMMELGSAGTAIDLAERALRAGPPPAPHHAWEFLALSVLAVADRFDAAARGIDGILAEARKRGAALTVAAALAHRAFVEVRQGDIAAAQADALAAVELAGDMVGSEFVLVMALPAAVNAGLDRAETVESLRRLIDTARVGYETELLAGSQLRCASAALRAAAGNHEAAIEELRTWPLEHPGLGGDNPAVLPWRSATALSLAELGRDDEAREMAAEEVRRAHAFGAPRAIGIALRAEALVGPREHRAERLTGALDVLASSPARLERARVLLDLGATLRAAGKRRAAREPLLDALSLAARCGATGLERRVRDELAAIGVRPRSTARSGLAALTPSELRVVEFAASGATNREIAQTLFVTEKTVETHLGRAFRKLDVASRRRLPDVLASAQAG